MRKGVVVGVCMLTILLFCLCMCAPFPILLLYTVSFCDYRLIGQDADTLRRKDRNFARDDDDS